MLIWDPTAVHEIIKSTFLEYYFIKATMEIQWEMITMIITLYDNNKQLLFLLGKILFSSSIAN